ncbi:MAG: NAD-dependent epimerase/dehydratase family protein [Thermomonas sp.]|uniref:NAD-dependent epimerase/dehydratase family protein n=1 Tax=Thermomonas sp. TaxID=1971895 RepID=UPI0039E488D8
MRNDDASSILVTGGAGFIGSRLVKALRQCHPDARIMVLDNLHPQVHGPDASPPVLPEGCSFLMGDVGEQEVVEHAVAESRPALVYHLAAETGTGQSYDEVVRYCRANVAGTANLIAAIRRHAGTRRVVLAASRAVYGEGGYRDAQGREFVGLPRDPAAMARGDFSVGAPPGFEPPYQAIASHAGLPPAPASIYASTKLMQEYLLQQAGEGAGWDAVMLRFQNVYGPGQSLRNPYTGVLSIFCSQLLAGQGLAIFEDGNIARDFVFVDDVVDALVRAGSADLPHGAVLDVGSGEAVTILEVARTLMEALGAPADACSVSGQFRVGDVRHARADISAARALLGWEPRVRLADGLGQLARWAGA